jgi:hypothetical protein
MQKKKPTKHLMTWCPKCEETNPPGWSFCPVHGIKLARVWIPYGQLDRPHLSG